MAHTPGPWIADDFEVRNESGELVAEVNYILDAHLIAAAPELLDALKLALLHISAIDNPRVCSVIESAIAKAEISSAAQE